MERKKSFRSASEKGGGGEWKEKITFNQKVSEPGRIIYLKTVKQINNEQVNIINFNQWLCSGLNNFNLESDTTT